MATAEMMVEEKTDTIPQPEASRIPSEPSEELKIKEENDQMDGTKTDPPAKKDNWTVFVGKLSDRVTPDELKKFFIEETKCEESGVVGVNMPWKVVKKAKKLGIAFVDFADQQIYEVALTLNKILFHGQNILVLPASSTHEGLLLMDGAEGEGKDGEDGRNKAGYIPVYKKSEHVAYIKNLPHGVSEDDVLEFFKFTRKDIVDIAIPIPFKAKRNAKRPVRAIIAFPTEEALEKCLSQTKTLYQDREVVVERHQMVSKVTIGEKRIASDSKDTDNEMTSSPEKQKRITSAESTGQMELDLFVKHIPREASDRQIQDFFASVGAIVAKVNLFSESVTGSTRGMGFVSMADKESVQRGLALDCKRFYKNKVRVSVRRDREHLDHPKPSELLPNFSVFVGNLPIKETSETLKEALIKHFESAECIVKDLHVPLASNRSGNKGYAFAVFENEDSLKKGQGLNNSELNLPDNKVSITISDRWPENDIPLGDKAKEIQSHRSISTAPSELPGMGKLRKRKKGLPLGGGSQGPAPLYGSRAASGPYGPRGLLGPQGPSGPRGPLGPRGPPGYKGPIENFGPQNPWNGPSNLPPNGPEFGPFGSDYQDYLDYLAYRDYVAMRKAYDERRELAEFRARYRADRDDEFVQQQQSRQPAMQSALPPPPPPPPLAPAAAQSSASSAAYSRSSGGMRKDEVSEFRNSSNFSGNLRERSDYNDNPTVSASLGSNRSRDFHDFEFTSSHGAGESGFSGIGTSGYGGAVGGSGGNSYVVSDQRGSSSFNFSDSISSSLNSSRYQTAGESTFSRSRLLENSAASSNSLGFSRDTSNGMDTSRGAPSNYNSAYPPGAAGDSRSLSSIPTNTGTNTRTSTHDSGRPYGSLSYLGHDRASSGGGVMGENANFGSTSGSYTSGDASQRYPYSLNSSIAGQGDQSHYYGYGKMTGFSSYRAG